MAVALAERPARSGCDRRLQLRDGRWLGYAEYGDPDGKPVVSFHGGMSCRIDVAFASSICAARGVRLISVDRPGIGSSDYKPGRTLLDWPDDVTELAAALGIERFALFGWSAGGPYVLACAARLAPRVTRGAIVGGMAPIDRPGAVGELGLRLDRLLFPLARRNARLASVLLDVVRALPARVMKWSLVQEVAPADREVIGALSAEQATDFVYEALRSGVRGTVHDYRLLGGPWGFELAEVAPEVLLWQGGEDRLVPLSHARYLAERLPHARLTILPGRGHFLLRTEMADIVEALTAGD